MNALPTALDLCCGKGGWTIGIQATGWDVIGVDIKNWCYPGRLLIQDVRTMDGTRFRGVVSLVVASPPCQEFSYRSFPFNRCRYLRDHVPPDTTIWDACVRIAREAGAPLVLENVRGAVRYMGQPANRYGPFYLWGDGVPALVLDGRGVTKGFGKKPGTGHLMNQGNRARVGAAYQSRGKRGPLNGRRRAAREFAGEYECVDGLQYKRMVGSEKYTGINGSAKHSGRTRAEWSANAAKIPYELAHWIGEYHKVRSL